ncbi:RDD family protein [Rhodococcus qingshengii]|uniref:RDD family protein n=1 Tax=Rhodococcus qingshengii TaxID=334542 RepID=UPI00237D23FE|nr:RDD family protein [Rhodococcus qingshengii]WCT05973.1 RDD family protein [Rhodococcus qingshengii]
MTYPPRQPQSGPTDAAAGHNHWVPPCSPLPGGPNNSPGAGQPYFAQDYQLRPPAQRIEYASWGRRVLATLVDFAFSIPYLISYTAMTTTIEYGSYDPRTGAYVRGHGPDDTLMVLTVILGLATFAFWIWNTIVRQGKTGASIGKRVHGILVVSEETGQPIGVGQNFLRQLAHVLDGLPCYIGYLFPLWEDKRRTFADMIMKTVVLRDLNEAPAPAANGVGTLYR